MIRVTNLCMSSNLLRVIMYIDVYKRQVVVQVHWWLMQYALPFGKNWNRVSSMVAHTGMTEQKHADAFCVHCFVARICNENGDKSYLCFEEKLMMKLSVKFALFSDRQGNALYFRPVAFTLKSTCNVRMRLYVFEYFNDFINYIYCRFIGKLCWFYNHNITTTV